MSNDRIEFGEFKLTDTTKQNVLACLESGWLTMGPVVKKFEEKWRNLFGYKYAKLLSSGTAADTASLMALYEYGASQGDEIICPALSFVATFNACRAAGFVPRFVDTRYDMNINEELVEEAITSKTRAILAVNLMGQPCRLDILSDICYRHNLKLIIDNCEAYGSKLFGKHALEYGWLETSSHYAAHIVGFSEGGSVSSNEEGIDKIIEAIRSHGRVGGKLDFNHPIYGLNFKNSDLHASVGLHEIDMFWESFNRRLVILRQMRQACIGQEDKAYFVEEGNGRDIAPHAFSIICKHERKIEKLQNLFNKANIAWKLNFKTPNQCVAFNYLNLDHNSYPTARKCADRGAHIGCHKYMSNADVDRICEVLAIFFKTY